MSGFENDKISEQEDNKDIKQNKLPLIKQLSIIGNLSFISDIILKYSCDTVGIGKTSINPFVQIAKPRFPELKDKTSGVIYEHNRFGTKLIELEDNINLCRRICDLFDNDLNCLDLNIGPIDDTFKMYIKNFKFYDQMYQKSC